MQPGQATANPVSGKACSSTKGGLLRYILNTYSIHKASSLKFAHFQGRLSRHITSPSEKTRPESWPGDYMGKATPFIPPLPPNVTNSRAEPQKPRQWKSMLIHQGWFTALYTQHLLDSQSLEFEICILQALNMPLIHCTNIFFQGRLSRHITSPSEKTRPEFWPGITWVRQPWSGSCHHPTAATKCNVRPSQATASPVGGKACSSTKGGLLRYILNTYSIHKVSSLKFAYFQGRLSRHRS